LSSRTGHAELFIMNSNGSDSIQITSLGSGEKWFNWAPDGKRLLVEWRSYSETRDIYVINADGSGQTRITDGGGAHWNASWSPDGRRILFVMQAGADAELFTVDAKGAGRIQVTNNDTWDQAPAWSPDGLRIAFVSQRGDWRLMVIDSRGQERQLATELQPDYVGVWSPSGERIAFVSDRDGDREIYVVSSDGSNGVQLTRNSADDFVPVWSRP